MRSGTVVIACTGDHIALFLNKIVQAKIILQHVKWVNEEKVHITVALRDTMLVWRYMKRNHIRGKIVRRTGAFFWLKKIKKRKFFVAGFALFLFLLFFLSSFIWYVDIEGNEQIPDKEIRTVLQKDGIYPGQLKVGLGQTDELQRKLLKQIPNASWIGVRLEGTRFIVTIAEKKQVDTTEEKKLVRRPINLVAKKDAFIVDMRVSRGNSVVHVHDAVKKGQLLVSGVYGDAGGPIVGAQGSVFGEVWYESEVEVPLTYVQNEYTGEKTRHTWPFIGSFVLTNPFQQLHTYSKVEMMRRVSALTIGKYQLPIGLVHDDYWAIKQMHYQRKQIEAMKIGKNRARLEMLSTIGADGKILTEKILHQRIENGKVYLKIYFDVVENIAQEKPILQGE